MLLMLLAAIADPSAAALTAARARTAAETHCIADPDSTDITVCGLRQADRFRVPLIAYEAGDPRHEGVAEERARLIHRTVACDDRGPFLIGCGSVGVTASTRHGITPGQRPLAP